MGAESFFLCKKFPFVPINLHSCRSREWTLYTTYSKMAAILLFFYTPYLCWLALLTSWFVDKPRLQFHDSQKFILAQKNNKISQHFGISCLASYSFKAEMMVRLHYLTTSQFVKRYVTLRHVMSCSITLWNLRYLSLCCVMSCFWYINDCRPNGQRLQ